MAAVFFFDDTVDPHVPREAVQPVITEQHYAICHLCPHAGHGKQGLLQGSILCLAQCGKVQCARGGKTCRRMHITRTVAKAAGRQLIHGKARKPARRGKSEENMACMPDGFARAQAQLLHTPLDGRDAFAL